MTLVAGVDSSTSSCKVEVRDAETGELVASGRAPHPPTTPRSEQDPAAWWRAFDTAAGAAGLFDRHRPAAIAVAGQQHGLVALNAAGSVIRPAKLWNDTESAPDAAELVDALGAAAWAEACGSVPTASFTITKLHWLHRCESDAFAHLAAIRLPHEWLTQQLIGADGGVTDRGDASGTGWWSPAQGQYRFDLLDLIDAEVDWAPMLPRVAAPTETVGEWQNALVGPGTGDNMAAALGLGLRPGELALSLGTSGTAFCVSNKGCADASGAVAGFADATGRYLPLVCTLNAMKVTDTVARLLGVDAAGFDALALTAPPGAGGMVLVPHFDGERTPNRPGATGVLSGIRSDATREQLARAAVEGVVANLLAGAEHLPPTEGPVMLVGGGAHSAAFRQVTADLLGRPVVVPVDDELVARGAACQAAAVLTGTPIDEVAAAWRQPAAAIVEPDPSVDATAIREAFAAAVQRSEP